MTIRTILATLSLAATALLAAGCGNHEDTPSEAAKYITVSTSIGQMTRVVTDADGSQRFEAGNEISVYAWTGTDAEVNTAGLVVDNSVNAYDGTAWTASPQMRWQDTETPHFFLGVYPKRSISDFTQDAYTLDAENQTASDLLVATNTKGLTATTAPGGTVGLEFDHVMAKLVVNLSFRSQWEGTPTVESVTAHDTATKAAINYLGKAMTASTADKADISLPATSANTRYASVMVPQSGFREVAVVIGGSTFTYTRSTDIPLERGRITTLNLIVGRDRIELGDISVNDWQQGETIEGGEAQND